MSLPARLLAAALLGAALSGQAFAGDILAVKKIDRRFPTGYCPIETRTIGSKAYGVFFTPGGTTAHVTFSANNFDSQNHWFAHRIDNVAVVLRSAFATHSGVTPGFDICYVDSNGAPTLFSDDATLTPTQMPFLETFETSAGGFDVANGAYFLPVDSLRNCDGGDQPSSAPLPTSGLDAGGGSLALGRVSDGAVTITTSVDVNGLTPGQEYQVTGWWWACQAETLRSLEIDVEGQPFNGTPGATLIGLDDLSQTSGVDRLVRFPNPATGVAQLIGSLGDNFRDCEALAVKRSTTGGPDRLFAVDNNRLLEIDPATGNGTVIGPVGFSDVEGLAFQPSTGILYGVTYGSNKILRIDTTTGHGTVVANDVISGRRLDDLAFHPDGRAFILTGGSPRLYQVNILTGAKIRRWDLTGGTSLEALVFSPDGNTLYTAADRGRFKDLATIDLTTSVVSFVGAQPSGFRDIEGLAFVGSAVAAQLARWGAPTDAMLPTRSARLLQNVPNPFNPTTRIEFDLARDDRVELTVHDVAGRLVAQIFRGELVAGRHEELWNGRRTDGTQAAAGLYLYTLRWTGGQETRRMVLVK